MKKKAIDGLRLIVDSDGDVANQIAVSEALAGDVGSVVPLSSRLAIGRAGVRATQMFEDAMTVDSRTDASAFVLEEQTPQNQIDNGII